jgi:hypothetical protein
VSVFGAPPDLDLLRAYEGLGVERVALFLPTQDRDGSLTTLDSYAAVVAEFRRG